MVKKSTAQKLLRATVVGLAAGCLVFVVLGHIPKPPLSSRYPKSTAIYAQDGELLRLTLASDGQFRLWTPLYGISPKLRDAALLYEDRWFYRHPGINPWALGRAAWATFVRGGHQGGSTITMQVSRQIYRSGNRTLTDKLKQIALALWLELRYGKDEILEAYLNGVSYGANIVGIGAASRIYFHKPAAELNLLEALTLAVIPQHPARRSPANGTIPDALLEARQRLWQRWLDDFPEDRRFANDLALPLAVHTRRELAIEAPHLTDLLLQRCAGATEIRSTVPLKVQRSLERAIKNFIRVNRAKGIKNASALLIDTQTMVVKAWVGSADYQNETIHGQVNGVVAKRSPGSTLKPFVYALALDQGLLHSQTILADLPTTFGSYSPENFDGRFIGPIAAKDALIRSRNVPAVKIAAQLSSPTLYQFLQRAGLARMRNEYHYGLSLALGGGEVTMEELAELYAMLSNQGVSKRLNVWGRTSAAEPLPLLSPAAAFITLDMLKHNPRPESKRSAEPDVAWKTGTSWGFRDAWSVGIIGHYALVVWAGNFDGSSNPELIGGKVAAPLFFSIVDSLRTERLLEGLSEPIPGFRPDTVAQIEVCAASGDLPNGDCPVRTKSWFIPGKSPIRTSTLHRAVYIDRDSDQVVCPGTPGSNRQIFEFWDSEMLRLFEKAGMPRRSPPNLPECYRGPDILADAPRIVSPARDGTYALRLGKISTLGLKANTTASDSIYWFANQSFIARTAPSETFSWLPDHPGDYRISAVDGDGRSASLQIRVELTP